MPYLNFIACMFVKVRLNIYYISRAYINRYLILFYFNCVNKIKVKDKD